MREQEFWRPFSFLLLGLLVWGAHFATVYGTAAVACELGLNRGSGLPTSVTVIATGAATLVALAVLGVALLRAWRGSPRFAEEHEERTHRFLRATSVWVAALAALAVIWQWLPVLLSPHCA